MPWPTSQDYNEAVQSPASHFADPDLCQGKAVADAGRLPMPCSGSCADVYRLRCPGGDFAVKCFTREPPGLRERYAAVSAHLGQADLPFLVDFQYLAPGVRVGDAWYPVVKMRWVEGVPLNAFVRDNLGKPAVLQELLGIWVGMARQLRAAGIAHADLQHRTVLAASGGPGDSLKVRLIGYDGMYVPALAGQPPGEVGHPNYQHPQRLREGTYSPEVDRFPLLVVATALCCLRVGGRWLWDRYDTGDNLLFRAADFAAPEQSPLFTELLKFPDPEVRSLAARLMAACQKPLEETPLLDDVFPEKPPAPAVAPAGAGQNPQEQTPRLEPASAWWEQRPWPEGTPNVERKPDAPAPASEAREQPWRQGAAPPHATDPAAPVIQLPPPEAPPPPVEEQAPAPPEVTPAGVPLPDEGQAAPQEDEAPSYEAHPDYRENLKKRMIGALVFGGAVLVALVVGGVILCNSLTQPESQVANDRPGPGPNHLGVNGAKPGEKRQRAMSCEDLWEKEKKGAVREGDKVIVAGLVTQEWWVDDQSTRIWKVEKGLAFVRLGDNGRGRAQLVCVYPERKVDALGKGKTYRFEGTYRGRRGAGGAHEVLLLTECKVVQ
jgi:hypothetical protein